MAAAGMPELPQRLGFDLADSLTGHREVLAYLFERVLTSILQAEAHLNDFFLARAERLEHFCSLLPQVQIDHRFRRRHDTPVDDEIAEVGLFFFTDRCFKRNGFLR